MTFGQFFQDNLFLFLLLAGVIGAIITLEIKSRGATGKKISNIQASIVANNGGILIDLRPVQDFKDGHIAGAINIPASELATSMAKIKAGKDSPVVVYDESGFQTSAAVKTLLAEGYSQISSLEMGFNGWVDDNLPVVSSK